MKKITQKGYLIIFLSFTIFLSQLTTAFCNDSNKNVDNFEKRIEAADKSKSSSISKKSPNNEFDLNESFFDKSRCCSNHNGVCGCDEERNRLVCCDGTLSPSCTCPGC